MLAARRVLGLSTPKVVSIPLNSPRGVAVTPDGSHAFVGNVTGQLVAEVDRINLSTGAIDASLQGGFLTEPLTEVAITPDGSKLFVTSNTAVGVYDTASFPASAPTVISGFAQLFGVVVTPDGSTAYVCDQSASHLVPINVATLTAGTPMVVAGATQAAITPDGSTAYVYSNTSPGRVTKVDLPTQTVGPRIATFGNLFGIAIAPDGSTAYVSDADANAVVPIALSTFTTGTAIGGLNFPRGIAIKPDGSTAYVCEWSGGTLTTIALPANTPGADIAGFSQPIDIAITPDGHTLCVAGSTSVAILKI